MPYCSAFGCHNVKSKDDCRNKTFFRFPFKNPSLLKMWLVKLRRKDFQPYSSSVVCSDHFEESCFEYQTFTNRRTLKPGSVPTKFNFSKPPSTNKVLSRSQPATSAQVNADVKDVVIQDSESDTFPRDPLLRKAWIIACRRDNWTPSNTSTLCSGHFSEDQIDRSSLCNVRLREKAVPNVFLALPSRPLKVSPQKLTARYVYKRKSKPRKNAAASKEEPHPLEPTVVIKEEPIEFEPTPSTSAEPDCIIKDEFILPHEENAWTSTDSLSSSGVDPAGRTTFSVACLGTDQDKTPSTNPVLGETRKRKANPSKLSVPGPSQKVARTSLEPGIVPTECLPSPSGNAGDSSNPSSLNESRVSDRSHDQFDAFGEYIAAKLRSLDKRACAFAQKAIGDIIFDAEMGKFAESMD